MARTHAALTALSLLRSAVAGDHGHQVAAWVRDTTLPLEHRLAAWKNASGACADPVDVATCAHKNNKLPCAPLRDGCARPCGAFAVKLYGTGAVTIREGVLLHLYGSEPRVMGVEGSSFADARYLAKAETYAKMGAKFVIAFREPIQRIVSRYWYDGRWPHGGPKQRSAAPLALGAWIDAVQARAHRRQLVACVSESTSRRSRAGTGKRWARSPRPRRSSGPSTSCSSRSGSATRRRARTWSGRSASRP